MGYLAAISSNLSTYIKSSLLAHPRQAAFACACDIYVSFMQHGPKKTFVRCCWVCSKYQLPKLVTFTIIGNRCPFMKLLRVFWLLKEVA